VVVVAFPITAMTAITGDLGDNAHLPRSAFIPIDPDSSPGMAISFPAIR
jgi:hypothetical protein